MASPLSTSACPNLYSKKLYLPRLSGMKSAEERREHITDAVLVRDLSRALNEMLMLQAESERKGAESMLERCAKHIENKYGSGKLFAKELRALPLPGDEEVEAHD